MISKAQTKPISGRIHPTPAPRLGALERALLRWSMAEAGDRVLDASVKTGALLETLQREVRCEVCGICGDMEHVRQTRIRLDNADIAYATAEDIPWRENSFDTVYLRMETADAPACQRMLSEARRVLKPGGQLLIAVHWLPAPLHRLRNALGGQDGDTVYQDRQELTTAMENAAFLQITWQAYDLIRGVMIGWKPMEPETDE